MAADVPTAAILLIGDELLSGKVRDENGHFIARLLRRRGIRLREIAVVGDESAAIGRALLRLCDLADIVFTSGGVGPTHDDVTLEAIAACTDRPLQRNARMEEQLRRHYGERISDAALRMADLPRGTQLRAEEGWPVLRLDLDTARVYILPGVPGLLRAKLEHLEALEGELPRGEGWYLALLHTTLDESKLATHLDAVLAEPAFAGVEIGSYPRWAREDDGRIHYHVRVTFEAPMAMSARVDAARAELASRLGPELLTNPSAPP